MYALILVDMQNDFMPFGSLPVPRGDEVVEVANALMSRFDLVVATQDWHPADHSSFASNHPGVEVGDTIDIHGVNQVMWPDHCVQGMPGASFHSALEVAGFGQVFRKGTDALVDSYSGFFDNDHRTATGLEQFLRGQGVTRLYVAGLATDYCVKYTVLDALELGFEVTVLTDGCRAVDLVPGDGERSIGQMSDRGAVIASSETLSESVG